ncbi:GntR family transcriptional regulator [Streptomyces sp. NL15-2K]|uniref:GntR family transcriptional regulator n=1 Tax=Streptomyces sp. NL15-2K TaxID=376149 RepID=UPI000FFAA44F|nr:MULTISPECIES: GntR family transcriptional regulator [Actinomycetes]WKX14319.1 GntR family transcriptional regulator [Kutzneria buriramensis]GCB44620.1 gntR family transcriptional regulator [Streptomyces sp. NL15-2K]
MSSQVHAAIKERLLEGAYKPGQRLSAAELGTEFGVSKQPTMEALRLLSADGLVTIVPQVGCEVATYEPQEVEDFFALFASMEGTISGLAASRRTEAGLRQLDAISGRIGDLTAETDPAARSHGYRVLNRDFHAQIHALAHSAVVAEVSHRMWDLSDFLINTSGAVFPLHAALEDRHHDHEVIRQALRDQDTEAARQEMERHVLGTLTIMH